MRKALGRLILEGVKEKEYRRPQPHVPHLVCNEASRCSHGSGMNGEVRVAEKRGWLLDGVCAAEREMAAAPSHQD